MFRGPVYRGGPILVSAISGSEQALWDIKGKYHNMPVYEMLGGACRSKIRMYGWARGEDVKTLVASALDRKKRGFTAIKYAIDAPNLPIMNEADADRHVEKIAALREAVGKEIDIGVDFHGRLSPANAIRLARKFEPYYPMFIEEPCLPENVDTMVTIARSTSIPIASGERLCTKWGFRELLEKQAVAIIQPDICHAGGILEARKIAAMSEVYYGSVAPHNPLGPIALSACLQLDASIPNFLIQEHPTLDTGEDRGVGIFKNPLVVKDGYIDIPKLPGLGFEFDEEALQDKLYDGSWQIPMLHHAAGSMADW